jgi:hypothetical protein
MSLTPGIIASSLTGHLVTSNFFNIATVNGNGVSTTLSFTSIPNTYKSLQIRGISKDTGTGGSGSGSFNIQFNSVTSNYSYHQLMGQTSAVTASGSASTTNMATYYGANSLNSGYVGASIIDIIDYASTSKYKTMRVFNGYNENDTTYSLVQLASGLYQSTSAISSIQINVSGIPAFTTATTFTLYGVS